MITKNRLEQLIKQGTIIFDTSHGGAIPFQLEKDIECTGRYYEITDKELVIMVQVNNDEDYAEYAVELKYLYEHEIRYAIKDLKNKYYLTIDKEFSPSIKDAQLYFNKDFAVEVSNMFTKPLAVVAVELREVEDAQN